MADPAIAPIVKDFKCLLANLKWFIARGKDYGATNYNSWQTKHTTNKNDIVAVITDFKYETMPAAVERYFLYLEASNSFTTLDLEFLRQFDCLEDFCDSETLRGLREKHLEKTISKTSVPNDPTENLASMRIHTSVKIENLTGEEEDMEDWFENFERIGRASNWSDEVKALKLSTFLKDQALMAWQTIGDLDKNSYLKSKKMILDIIRPDEVKIEHFYNRNHKDSESILEYGLKLKKIAVRLFSTSSDLEKILLEKFWKGLKPEIKKIIFTSTPTTFEEALKLAQKAEKFLKESSITMEISEVNSYAKKERSRSRSKSPVDEYRDIKGRSSTPAPTRTKSPEMRKCYNCGKNGHLARDCRNLKGKYSKSHSAHKCYKCGSTKHLIATCPLKD